MTTIHANDKMINIHLSNEIFSLRNIKLKIRPNGIASCAPIIIGATNDVKLNA